MSIVTAFLVIVVILLVIVAAAVAWGVGAYNALVQLRNRVDNAWAQIDVQLKARADLVPNLVETVRGYADHESAVFAKVTEARARAGQAAASGDPAARAAAENQLGQSLMGLVATAEAYPQLRADGGFVALQGQLTDLERRLAYSRQFYNDTVTKYNTRIQTVPSNMIAQAAHFIPAQYFAADAADVNAPRVSFTR